MGTFTREVTVSNLLKPTHSATVDCLVDTGEAYSQLPQSLLKSLGITPFDERTAILADGRKTRCRIGKADFTVNGRQTPSLVIFGEESAPPLLGAITIEGLGLGVDPLAKRLIPIDIPLAPYR